MICEIRFYFSGFVPSIILDRKSLSWGNLLSWFTMRVHSKLANLRVHAKMHNLGTHGWVRQGNEQKAGMLV